MKHTKPQPNTDPTPAATDAARMVIAEAIQMERLHQPLLSGPQKQDFRAADRVLDALAANGLIITAMPPSGQVVVSMRAAKIAVGWCEQLGTDEYDDWAYREFLAALTEGDES